MKKKDYKNYLLNEDPLSHPFLSQFQSITKITPQHVFKKQKTKECTPH